MQIKHASNLSVTMFCSFMFSPSGSLSKRKFTELTLKRSQLEMNRSDMSLQLRTVAKLSLTMFTLEVSYSLVYAFIMSTQFTALFKLCRTSSTFEVFDSVVNTIDVALQVSFGRVLSITKVTVMTTRGCV